MLLLEGPKEAPVLEQINEDLDFHELADGMRHYLGRYGHELHHSNSPADIQLFECLESTLFGADDYMRECADIDTAREVTSGIKEILAGMQETHADQTSVDFGHAALRLALLVEARLEKGAAPSNHLLAIWAFTPKIVSAPRDRRMTAPGKPAYIPR
jgi:hypothetical protein